MAFSDHWRGDRSRNRDEGRRTQAEGISPGEDRDRNGLQGEGFQRRGWREGSDYYGNKSERYGTGNSDAGAYGAERHGNRDYAGGEQSRGGSARDRREGGGSDYEARDFGRGERSFNDRWQNAYGGQHGAPRYAGYSGYGGGDYGERDSDRGFGASAHFGRQFGEPGRSEGQFRGRGPKGYRRSDERIREDACERLTEDDRIDASNIDVRVKDCEVTLSGSVSSREEKRRAEDVLERLSGVKDVHNQLRVVNQGGAPQNTG